MTHRQNWMTDDQWECAQMLADIFAGFHHLDGNIKKHGEGIEMSTYANRMATFDFSNLTLAVVLAHDRMIRLSLESSGPRMVKIVLFKRHTREGSTYGRHPTIEQAVADVRKYHGEPL